MTKRVEGVWMVIGRGSIDVYVNTGRSNEYSFYFGHTTVQSNLYLGVVCWGFLPQILSLLNPLVTTM